ncbi:MAG: hypothetical protein NUW23_08965, partial [Firmicutes bacterium]|nr:hypothetical protein [Bacillota bacterium]
GFGFVGFVDDVLGDHSRSGFSGHLTAAIRDRALTSGMFKVVMGGAVSLAGAALLGRHWVTFVLDAIMIALAANFVNLLDRRPGRAIKAYALLHVLTVTSGYVFLRWFPPAEAAAVFGSAVAFAPRDLRERAMLGDTGANPLGASLGLSLVHLPLTPRLAALFALAALTLLSEFRSFGSIIDGNRVLRFLDELGRAET